MLLVTAIFAFASHGACGCHWVITSFNWDQGELTINSAIYTHGDAVLDEINHQ